MVKNLFKDSVLYGTMNAVQKAAPFFIIPLVTRHLGKEALKVYDVSFAYVVVFLWLVVLGQDAAASVLYFDEKKTSFNKRQVTTYAFLVQLSSLLVFTALLLPFSQTWGGLLFSNDVAIASWWQFALAVLPGHLALNYALNVLLWQKRKAAYATLCLLQSIVSIASVWLSLVFFHGGLTALFYCIIGSTSLTALVGMMMIAKQLTAPVLPVNTALLKTLLRLGLPFALTAFFSQLLPSVDRLFLLHFGYGDKLASYVLAAKLGSLVNFGTSAFVLAFTPFSLAKLNEESAEEDLSNLFRVVSTIAFLAVPFLLLFKNLLIAFFADASYQDAAVFLPFFFFGWVFDLFYYFTVLGIYRSQKTHLSLVLFFLVFVLISLFNLLLVPQLGLYGAALSFCLCKAAVFFLSLFWLQKHFHLRIHAGSFVPAFAVAVVCSYAAYRLPLFVNVFVFTLLLFAVVFYLRKKK